MPKSATKTKSRTTRAKKTAKTATARRKTAVARKAGSRAKAATGRKTAARKSPVRKAAGRSAPTRGPARRGAAAKVPMAIRHAAQELKTSLAVAEMPDDAIAMLQQDHREVEALFEEFENTQNKAAKAALAAKICLELRVHTQIEEEILYPPAHREIEHDLVDEAIVEHASAKDLIHQIEAMDPSEHLYDAKLKVLSEYVQHHVKEEEKEMFSLQRDLIIGYTMSEKQRDSK